MKNLSIVLVAMIVSIMLSCSKDNQNVVPSSQSSLSMVIPQAGGGSSNLLLLKDGRTANPVSGIPNFSTMKVGDKLSLSFRTGAVHNGVVDIDVTKVASAQDSVFIPSPPSSDTTSFNGTFTGVAYVRILLDSFNNPIDTVTVTLTKNISISFSSPNHYSCTGNASGYPAAGNGTFVVSNGQSITFTDNTSNSDQFLNGSFTYCIYKNDLYMYSQKQPDINGTYLYGYSLTRVF